MSEVLGPKFHPRESLGKESSLQLSNGWTLVALQELSAKQFGVHKKSLQGCNVRQQMVLPLVWAIQVVH